MPMRFRRSIKLGKGVRLNVSKSGFGLSAGVRGARCSVHSSGRRTRYPRSILRSSGVNCTPAPRSLASVDYWPLISRREGAENQEREEAGGQKE